jgi:hypothetical protein
MAGATMAQANFMLNNEVRHEDDLLYRFDKDEQKKILEERPWKHEYAAGSWLLLYCSPACDARSLTRVCLLRSVRYFKKVKISSVALLKMVCT